MPASSSQLWLIWIAGTAALLAVAGGLVAAIIIHQRKLLGLEKEKYRILTETEEQNRLLLELLPLPLAVCDSDRILFVNPALQGLVGAQSRLNLIGKKWIEFIPPADRVEADAVFTKILNGNRTAHRLEGVLAGGGSKHVGVEFSLMPIDYRGQPAVMVVCVDLTERKQIEELQRQREAALFQRNKLEALGQLAGGIAHDFNNILAGIIGNAELLGARADGQRESSGFVQDIIRIAESGSAMTNRLLSFARKNPVQAVPVNIHQVISDAAGILANTIDRKVRIAQHMTADRPMVMGDPSQLESALLNLGLNARDAMPGGGELIFRTETVRLGEQPLMARNPKMKPGRHIKISVTDTGTGLSDEVKTHLFEPFFTTKDPGKGTGLGLAGVYGIVSNHGGGIEVESQQGKGAAFHIYLPEVSEGGTPTTRPKIPENLTHTERVLVVDDDVQVREITRKMLEELGCKVHACKDGKEAVDYYREHPDEFDLVILDMVMPNMGGKETFKALKELNPGVKVLLASGYSVEDEAREVMELGAKGFIQKPYRLVVLAAQMRDITNN